MKTALVILYAVVSITTHAQTDVKNIMDTKQLNGVVVKAQMQRSRTSVPLYYLSSYTKMMVQNAINLLNYTAIY
jgi:hypothetical protein